MQMIILTQTLLFWCFKQQCRCIAMMHAKLPCNRKYQQLFHDRSALIRLVILDVCWFSSHLLIQFSWRRKTSSSCFYCPVSNVLSVNHSSFTIIQNTQKKTANKRDSKTSDDCFHFRKCHCHCRRKTVLTFGKMLTTDCHVNVSIWWILIDGHCVMTSQCYVLLFLPLLLSVPHYSLFTLIT